MIGLTPYLIERSENFDRSFKKLSKVHGEKSDADLKSVIREILDS